MGRLKARLPDQDSITSPPRGTWNLTYLNKKGSPTRTRTWNLAVNSRPLCQLSYQGTLPLLYPMPAKCQAEHYPEHYPQLNLDFGARRCSSIVGAGSPCPYTRKSIHWLIFSAISPARTPGRSHRLSFRPPNCGGGICWLVFISIIRFFAGSRRRPRRELCTL